MRVIFMGTPAFSVPILDAIAASHDVVAVYCQPPSVSGRGQKQRLSEVHARAIKLGLSVRTPKSLKSKAEQDAFAAFEADVAVVAAYGLILPQAILDAPQFGCLNVHASLLPRWRGAAPIQRAIMAGDSETGVTIMQMDAGLDTGAMLLKDKIPLSDSVIAGEVHDALSEMGARLSVEALNKVAAGPLSGQSQPEDGVTYASKIDKAEAAISFDRPAQEVVRHIHGLSPFPGAFIELDGQRIKFLRAEVAARPPESDSSPGLIMDHNFTIACTTGAIRPLQVQRAGKGPVDVAAFLRGFELRPGASVGR